MNRQPGWLTIPRWDGPDGFQHYRDRDPIWIKNYTRLMADDAYLTLTGHRRGILHGLWLEYASSDRRLRVDTLSTTPRLRLDTSSIARRLGLRVTTADLEALNHAGFIHFSASAPLAQTEQHASPRARQGRDREENNKQDQQQSARDEPSGDLARARDPQPVDDDLITSKATADELGSLLDALGATGGLARAARADAGRAVACAKVALERDQVTNRAGYFRALLEAGTWPQTVTATRGANVLPADPVAALERELRNGVPHERDGLERVLAELDVDEVTAARLRALLPADSGRETRDPSVDAPSSDEEPGGTAPGHHGAELERVEPSAGDLEPEAA